MHHGQGVQEIFYGRDDVLYVSIHGDPTNFYPVVAGFDDERGAGEGEGYNINLPMPHGSSEEVFFDAARGGAARCSSVSSRMRWCLRSASTSTRTIRRRWSR